MICNGINPESSNCTKTGIAWTSDVQTRFKGANSANYAYNNTYYNETGHLVPNSKDEDFIVWMKSSPLPMFRKLYRVINVAMPKGDYYLNIDYSMLKKMS